MDPVVKRYWELFEQLRPTEADFSDGLYVAAALLVVAEHLHILTQQGGER